MTYIWPNSGIFTTLNVSFICKSKFIEYHYNIVLYSKDAFHTLVGIGPCVVCIHPFLANSKVPSAWNKSISTVTNKATSINRKFLVNLL